MKKYYLKNNENRQRQDFEKNFADLSIFLSQHNRLPERADNPKLYTWMSNLMHAHKKGRLIQEYVDRLNSIGVVWNKREFNWLEKAQQVKYLLEEQKHIPTYNQDTTLYHWLNAQLKLLSEDKLTIDKKGIVEQFKILIEETNKASIQEPVIKVPAKEIKWTQKFNELVEYKKQNPKRWPQVEANDEKEKKLGIWCQDLRSRYRRNLLDDNWVNKLLEMGFNLEGRLDNWKEHFAEFKTYVSISQALPAATHNLYIWARLQYKMFNELSFEKKELLNSINFVKYFEEKTWDRRYSELQEFILLHKSAPTKNNNLELYNWLKVQRTRFRTKRLTDNEKEALLNFKIYLITDEAREDAWNKKYVALIKFRERYPDRWPRRSNSGEKMLYQWCQAQRQVYAKTAKRRKELSQDRVDKLNLIGFRWSIDDLFDRNWEHNFQKLSELVAQNRSVTIPAMKNGMSFNLYTWLHRQKVAIKQNKLPADKYNKLRTLGVL